jgi:hypothetical protein
MVATSGLALACLLTNQEYLHGSDYASRNRRPTAFFSGVQSAPFEFDPRRNINVNKHSSSTRLFAELAVKVLDQDVAGTMSKEVDHSPLGFPVTPKADSLRSQENGKDLLQEALLADEYCWTPAADDDGKIPQQTDDRHEEALVALTKYFAGNFDGSGKTNF